MSMRYLTWTVVFGIALSHSVGAQFWKPLGTGSVGIPEIQRLYTDTVTDRLMLTGSFAKLADLDDTVLCVGIGQWDGQHFDSVATRITLYDGSDWSPATYCVFRYQGRLYANGEFPIPLTDSTASWAFGRLNEDSLTWEPLECINADMGGMDQLLPREPQDTLYATGYMGTICGYPQSCVFQYDGTQFLEWLPFNQIPYEGGNYVSFIFKFLGFTYMSGDFSDPVSPGYATFLRYDGSSWEHVPGWGQAQGAIKDYIIRSDTLYLAGGFHEYQGAPGNLVAAYTGSSWVDLGGGLTNHIPQNGLVQGIEFFHNELWACGYFDSAGHVPAENIAKWNGQQWCSLPGVLLPVNGLGEMAVWRDSLYLCGGFLTADGQPARRVAQWIGGDAVLECSSPVGVIEPATPQAFSIFPDPATDEIQISGPDALLGNAALTITNALGQVVLQALLGKSRTVDVTQLNSGVYLARLSDRNSTASTVVRFVKK